MAHNAVLNSRVTWAVGGFWNTESFSNFGDGRAKVSESTGANVTARVTGLPMYDNDGRKLLHVGLSYAYQFRRSIFNDAPLRLRARPESRLTDDRLVDTGLFNADVMNILNLEFAAISGPFSFQGELYTAVADADHFGDSIFFGYYLHVSHFLTGERRNYNTSEGVFSPVKPNHNFCFSKGGWGAWQLAGRLSYIDLNDEGIQGGKEFNLTAALNWHLNEKTRFMFNYIRAAVEARGTPPDIEDRLGHIYQARFQISF
jgi:phosphate-selective porin OprO/OprP